MNLEEINLLVAEKVMGYSRKTPKGNESKTSYYEWRGKRYVYARRINSFKPSIYDEDALEVFNKFAERDCRIEVSYNPIDKKYTCLINLTNKKLKVSVSARTFSLAVCLSALKAVGVEVAGTE